MLERVLAEGSIGPGTRVVAMLSGGRDSVCMLDLAVRAAGPAAVTALHVNYGLRDDSDADERHCQGLCEALGVEDHRFLWAARRTGFRQWADHRVESLDPGNCRVELAFGVDGMLGPVVGPLARRTVVRLVDAEAAHLKSHAERGGGPAS